MKTYTLINLLTRSMAVVEADTRTQAQHKACDLAKNINGQYTDHCYWIAKQDYHDTTCYKVLA